MKRIGCIIAIILISLVWGSTHITIRIETNPAIEAAFPQVQTGQIADEAVTLVKLAASLQSEWNQFRNLVGDTNEITWTVSAVQQITDPNTTLTITHGIQQFEGIGGVILTSTPTIADGIDGQLARIRCVSDTNLLIFQSETNYPGSELILSNGQDFYCGHGDSMLLAFNGLISRWEEISRIDIQ
jgi:hypothetical protein